MVLRKSLMTFVTAFVALFCGLVTIPSARADFTIDVNSVVGSPFHGQVFEITYTGSMYGVVYHPVLVPVSSYHRLRITTDTSDLFDIDYVVENGVDSLSGGSAVPFFQVIRNDTVTVSPDGMDIEIDTVYAPPPTNGAPSSGGPGLKKAYAFTYLSVRNVRTGFTRIIRSDSYNIFGVKTVGAPWDGSSIPPPVVDQKTYILNTQPL